MEKDLGCELSGLRKGGLEDNCSNECVVGVIVSKANEGCAGSGIFGGAEGAGGLE